jgi:type I restriction enzyme, S subunit
MTTLSYMEKLLDGGAVEWKTLEEVANFANGKGHEKDIIEDGKYVVVNSKFISTDGRVAKFSNIQICPLFKDDILLVMSDLPNGKALSKTFIVDADDRYTLNQRIGGITVKNQEEILPKFLHCFLNRTPQLLKYDNGVDQTNLRKDQILGVKIPIPCPDNPEKSLAIQAEIVRILDTFTALTAELIAELTAELIDHKKQYNYYRDRLLTFEKSEVEWKKLGEVATLITKGTTPKVFTDSGINFVKLESFDNGRIDPAKFMFISIEAHSKELKRSILQSNDILFAIAGATIGKCSVVEQSILPANTNQALAIVRLGEGINVKFVFYCMQTAAMKDYIAKYNKASAQPNLNLQQISDFRIPFPPLPEQNRIVSLLDKFDTLTTSISEGLPREITLRQKQYEYYRDLLLTFPKSEEIEV